LWNWGRTEKKEKKLLEEDKKKGKTGPLRRGTRDFAGKN